MIEKMKEKDYSIETDEEFYEDFSGINLSDEELNEVLIKARKNSDAELRFIVKELQYTRFLLKHVVEFVDDSRSEFSHIRKLAEHYVNTIVRASNKNL